MNQESLEKLSKQHPIVVYDGYCMLCSYWVQWIIKRDNDQRYRYLSSDLLQADTLELPYDLTISDTVWIIDHGRLFVESDVTIHVLGGLGWPWNGLTIVKWVPKSVRNAIYRFVARNRYRWFGKRESCWIPNNELSSRFIG